MLRLGLGLGLGSGVGLRLGIGLNHLPATVNISLIRSENFNPKSDLTPSYILMSANMAATLVKLFIFFMILFKIPFYSTFTFPKTINNGLLASHLDSSELYESILAIISSPVARFNYKVCSSKPNIRRCITKWSKYGLLFIQAPELDFPIDLTICGDIESNPGEITLQSTKRTQAQNQAIHLNRHVNYRSERIVYSSDQLLSIRAYASTIPLELKTCLKSLRIAKLTRGIRAGKSERTAI